MNNNVSTKKKTEDFKRLILDIVVISFGLVVSSLGTALFYAVKLGSSPMATFNDGLHNVLNVSYGTANVISNGTLLIFLYFIRKSYINIGTVLCVFFIGPCINLFGSILSYFPMENLPMAVKYICVFIGTFMMGTGLGLYVAVERGFGPLEAIVKLLCENKGLSYSKAKVIQDIILVAGGLLLKAKWGGGTIIAAFLTGSILQRSIQFFTPRLKKHA